MFDLWSQIKEGGLDLIDNFLVFLDGLFRFLYNHYEESKKVMYKMGYGTTRKITLDQFRDVCTQRPEY